MPKRLSPQGKAASPARKAPAPAKKASQKKKPTPRSKPAKSETEERSYIRNIRGTWARLTLHQNDRRIELEPRGQRGDMAMVTPEEREDDIYRDNLGYIFEEVRLDEGKKIIAKQQTNAAPQPTIMDHIRNPHGDPYQQPATVEASMESQGQVVANIEQKQGSQHVDQIEEITRASGAAPVQQAVPGSIGNPGITIPPDMPAEQVAAYVAQQRARAGSERVGDGTDNLARQNSEEAAAALREGLNVSVGPTQRDIIPGQ